MKGGLCRAEVTFTAVKQNNLGAAGRDVASHVASRTLGPNVLRGGRGGSAGHGVSFSCVTLKPNTYLPACKTAVSARPPQNRPARYGPTVGHTRPTNPKSQVHVGSEPRPVKGVIGTFITRRFLLDSSQEQ